MITRLIWTIWTLRSTVHRKAIKSNHSLTSHQLIKYKNPTWGRWWQIERCAYALIGVSPNGYMTLNHLLYYRPMVRAICWSGFEVSHAGCGRKLRLRFQDFKILLQRKKVNMTTYFNDNDNINHSPQRGLTPPGVCIPFSYTSFNHLKQKQVQKKKKKKKWKQNHISQCT